MAQEVVRIKKVVPEAILPEKHAYAMSGFLRRKNNRAAVA